MTEACVEKKKGTYLFCDTDSLAIVSSKIGGSLNIPGGDGRRMLSWKEVQNIVDRFVSLNPYDPKAVKGSILNLVDANYIDSESTKPQRQLYGYSIAAKRYALYERIGIRKLRSLTLKRMELVFCIHPQIPLTVGTKTFRNGFMRCGITSCVAF